MAKNKAIIISGATATGKTALSVEIARHFPNYKFEIVNFDSLLFYKEINIGTAKPSLEEQNEIPHHLIDIATITNEINANQFEAMCSEIVDKLHSENKIPILVGGSTFYLRSYIKGMYDSITPSIELQEKIKLLQEQLGISYFIEYLKKHDPDIFNYIHENDQYRIIRAYEHHQMTGEKLSIERKQKDDNSPYDFSITKHDNIDFLHLSLLIEKEKHWKIMKERANNMIASGLIEEVQEILRTFSGDEKPLASIGYKETIDFIKNNKSDKLALSEEIYINTRKLAKAQKTFLQKVTPKHTINPLTDTEIAYKLISEFLN